MREPWGVWGGGGGGEGHRDRNRFDWVVCKSFGFEMAVFWIKERIHIYYQNIKFNNLYMCCNLNFDLTVLISICKLSSTLLPLNLYVLPPTSVLTE